MMKKRIISMLLLLVLTISLIGCAKNDPEVVSINNQIEELNNIQDNRESILEIMNIREEIEILSSKQKKWVKTKQLNNISNQVSNKLKDSIGWKDYFDRECDYVLLSDFVVFSNLISVSFRRSVVDSGPLYCIENNDYISNFKSLINVPFSLVTNPSDYLTALRESAKVSIMKIKYVFVEFDNASKNGMTIWFHGGWFYFSITENDEVKYYVSLLELTEEQLNSLFDLSELSRKGYIQFKR